MLSDWQRAQDLCDPHQLRVKNKYQNDALLFIRRQLTNQNVKIRMLNLASIFFALVLSSVFRVVRTMRRMSSNMLRVSVIATEGVNSIKSRYLLSCADRMSLERPNAGPTLVTR